MSESLKTLFVRPATPVDDPEIRQAKSRLSFESAIVLTQNDGAHAEYLSKYRSWIAASSLNHVRGIDRYPFASYSHGTTQAMDHFLFRHSGRRIRLLRGEYPYLRDLLGRLRRPWLWMEDEPLAAGDALMVSHPFSGSGGEHPRFRPLLNACDTLGIPVFVDCAFFGICGEVEFPLDHPAIESVAFSLSKIFAVGLWRIGMVISRVEDAMLALQSEWGYVNHMGMYVGTRLMDEFDPDWLVRKYRDAQHRICRDHGLQPSPSCLFGIGGEAYSDFHRDHAFNRVCISATLERELKSTHA